MFHIQLSAFFLTGFLFMLGFSNSVSIFISKEGMGRRGGGCEAVQMRGHIFLKWSRGHITYSLVILVCVHEEKS